MFKQILKLEVKGANDRTYTLHIDSESPLGELNDALYTMKSLVVDQITAQHKKDKSQEKTKEEQEKK